MDNQQQPPLKDKIELVVGTAANEPQSASDTESGAGADSEPSVPTKQLEVIQTHKERQKHKKTLVLAQVLIFVLVLGAIGAALWMNGADLRRTTPDYHSQNSGFGGPSMGYNLLSNPNVSLPWATVNNLSKVGWEKFQMVLLPVCGISAIGLVFMLGYAGQTRRKYIEFDKIGILISDSRERGQGNARFIPWGCLEAVETIYSKKSQMIATGKYEPRKSTQHAVAEQILGTDDPNNCTVAFYVDDGSVVNMSWRDITSCCEPGTFINALKTWAPDIRQTCNFPGQVGKVDSDTYTQLWFKYYSTGSDRKRTSMLDKGDVLQEGRFEIAGQLGGGGQGTAYLAVDKAPSAAQSEIVLKEYILPVHRGQQVLEQTVEKLKAEANILRKIDHPHIVKMLGEFIEDHRGYLIMEYVSGRSLKALVAQEGPQPESFVVDMALQMCSVLHYLHTMAPPVVHRDLTPDNLILQESSELKLVDFNVAHQLESAATATVVGKHAYIPPEQFRGKPTPQSDIYAFGGTLHFLLTAQDPEPLTVSHPKNSNGRVSTEMDVIVAGCTALDAGKRFASAKEVASALQQLKAATVS